MKNKQHMKQVFDNKIKKIINEDVKNIVNNLRNTVNIPDNFNKFKEYLNTNLNISDEDCLKLCYQYIFLKPIIDLTIHPEVIKNNKILKYYTDLNLNEHIEKLKEIPEMKACYSKIENELNSFSLDRCIKANFLTYLYNILIVSFIGKKADVEGVVYTSKEITNFMVKMTNDVLKKYFNSSLYNKGVNITEPFLGTGNYIESIVELADQPIESDIQGYEINPISGLIASLNIENQFYIKYNKYIEFNNVKICDTFEEYEKKYQEKNKEANKKHHDFF